MEPQRHIRVGQNIKNTRKKSKEDNVGQKQTELEKIEEQTRRKSQEMEDGESRIIKRNMSEKTS
jgi:hypothetical protein